MRKQPLGPPGRVISFEAAAKLVIDASSASITTIVGLTREQLRLFLENVEGGTEGRLALFVPLTMLPTPDSVVEHIVDTLADTALRMWPVWFTDVSFANCRNNVAGRDMARTIVRGVADTSSSVSRPWAEAAAILALAERKPRLPGIATQIELEQLCLAVNRSGLVVIVDLADVGANTAAAIHALEWMTQHSCASVIALFGALPGSEPPFDRILHAAYYVATDNLGLNRAARGVAEEEPWLVPVRGMPHPLSEIEQKLAKMLASDGELATLFGFNQVIETVRGSRPKVDLVWSAGRLVVELDGYGNHGNRMAFMYDRHRDYELALSGYTVLRLANDEIAQDIEKALEKIRDMVQVCRDRAGRRT